MVSTTPEAKFPAKPDGPVDERGLFLCQDPFLRARIMPLFTFDPKQPEGRPSGHGTTFRIDPWGACATAFHVVEELLHLKDGQAVLRDDIRLAAFELEGLVYGRVGLPAHHWRPMAELGSFYRRVDDPLRGPGIGNLTELAALGISRSSSGRGKMPYLPVDLKRWRPKLGETVMALGFADLDVDHRGEGDERPMEQYMYGSEAVITEIQPADPNSTRPWPIFRVEANWPGGMSGGPVFNQEGHVIGLVSTGFAGVGISAATFFSGWNFSDQTFPYLDVLNPGKFTCWGGFDEAGHLLGMALTRQELEENNASGGMKSFRRVTANPETGDFILLS